MSEAIKRGSRGGDARKAKLPPERRREIAQEAAKKRWAKPKDETHPIEEQIPIVSPIDLPAAELEPIPEEPQEKHCPACMNGESLEEGQGTHILATVEHPVTLPAGFEDAEQAVSVPAAPVPLQKPTKHKAKSMPKELRTASSYAKRTPVAAKEKADLLVEVARREAEIQELTRVIQALGGQAPVGIPNGSYPTSPYQPPYTPPQLPPTYPEYAQPAAAMPVVAQVRPMHAGGAGVAQGMLEVPNHWYNE